MEAYANPGPHKAPVPIDIQFDENELDQILQQIQFENSLSLGDTCSYPTSLDALPPSTATIFSSWALSPSQDTSFDSPPALSLTASSLTESPVVPEYDFLADMLFLPNDEAQIVFPDLMDPGIEFPPEWSTADPSWTDGQLGCDVPAAPWDQDLSGVDFPPQQQQQQQNLQPRLQPEHQPPRPHQEPKLPTTTARDAVLTTPPRAPDHPPAPSSTTSPHLVCPHCALPLPTPTKLKIHINKHTKPFRCPAVVLSPTDDPYTTTTINQRCPYATAEKKSLRRHLLARSRYDEAHRAAAADPRHGVAGRAAERRACPGRAAGCTYATVREDNLKRHLGTCGAAAGVV